MLYIYTHLHMAYCTYIYAYHNFEDTKIIKLLINLNKKTII